MQFQVCSPYIFKNMKINLISQHSNTEQLVRYFSSVSKLISKSLEKKLIDLNIFSVYDYSKYPDDKAFSGNGMCLKYGALEKIMLSLPKQPIFFLNPDGIPLNNKLIHELLNIDEFILISSRYEGIDERFINNYVTSNISIGDYVLSNGDIPATVLIDALLRKKGMVKGKSLESESFDNNKLDFAVYTKPRYIENNVPEVLMSGNHKNIEAWREKYSLFKTIFLRPDMMLNMTEEDIDNIKNILNEIQNILNQRLIS